VHDYQKLKVWQAAHQLVLDSYQVARGLLGFERFALADQIRRAAVSVSANIAEGAGRGRGSFPYFLRIAAGSVCELEAEFEIAHDLEYINTVLHQNLFDQTTQLKRMLWKLVQTAEKDRPTQNPART
jgi:four helix bundle protein